VRTLDDLQDLTALATVSLLWEQWPTWRDEAQEHCDILAAVEGGRAADAEALVRSHIQRSIHRLENEPEQAAATR
jgi:DNA-binding GntR family transcriptional regulator